MQKKINYCEKSDITDINNAPGTNCYLLKKINNLLNKEKIRNQLRYVRSYKCYTKIIKQLYIFPTLFI